MTEFMTDRKKKVMDTFERILPVTSEREDDLLLAFMEGVLKFKKNEEQKTA